MFKKYSFSLLEKYSVNSKLLGVRGREGCTTKNTKGTKVFIKILLVPLVFLVVKILNLSSSNILKAKRILFSKNKNSCYFIFSIKFILVNFIE